MQGVVSRAVLQMLIVYNHISLTLLFLRLNKLIFLQLFLRKEFQGNMMLSISPAMDISTEKWAKDITVIKNNQKCLIAMYEKF